jgi:hypothetical protein
MTFALDSLINLVQTLRPDLDRDQCRDLLSVPAVGRDVLSIDQLRRLQDELVMTTGMMVPVRSLGDLTTNCKRMSRLLSKWMAFNAARDMDFVPEPSPDWLAEAYSLMWDMTLHNLDVLHHGTIGSSDAGSVLVANFLQKPYVDQTLIYVSLQGFLLIDPVDPLWENSAARAGYVAYLHAVKPSAVMTYFVMQIPAWLADLLEELHPGIIGMHRYPSSAQKRIYTALDIVKQVGTHAIDFATAYERAGLLR